MSRSAPHPRSKKTPRGGRKMARMILQMSLRESMLAIENHLDDVSCMSLGRMSGLWFTFR